MLRIHKTLGSTICICDVNSFFFFNLCFVIPGITKSAIYAQLQSNSGKNTKNGYDAKVCLVVSTPRPVRANGGSRD